jgi:DNA-binding MarR family transcriptional regulator
MTTDPSHRLLAQGDELGHESRAAGDDHAALKLWLRLLACTAQVEAEISRRLRQRFGISLPRFDYLAQLHRRPEGLKMGDLSRCLMVTGGNITGLTDELTREGLVLREPAPGDRRAWIVRLTDAGRSSFEAMASAHECWILELFAGLDAGALQQVYRQLGTLRVHLMNLPAAELPPPSQDKP